MSWLKTVGFNFFDSAQRIRRIPWYWSQYRSLVNQRDLSGVTWEIEPNHPCLLDAYAAGGTASGHYFHQDLLVARRIHGANPERHVDVGSRIDGFVAHVAVFRSIEVIDIRPIRVQGHPNITFKQANLLSIPDELTSYCDSVSCLHALEHFGLGRYGDPLDIDGYTKGFNSLTQMLRSGGTLYLSVPIGRQRIEFNAHRIFSPRTIEGLASESLNLTHFSYVDDSGALFENVGFGSEVVNQVSTLNYGCGIFEFVKR